MNLLIGHKSEIVKIKENPNWSNEILSSDIEGKICYWKTNHSVPYDIKYHENNYNIPGICFNSLNN